MRNSVYDHRRYRSWCVHRHRYLGYYFWGCTVSLSPHFTLDEFTFSQTAARRGIDNTPSLDVLDNLQRTAHGLELVRDELGGHPILISSGYRSPALNEAVSGSPRSQHIMGLAVDFTCPAFGTPAEIAKRLAGSEVPYAQVILEFNKWVHISFSGRNRRHALVIDATGTKDYAA